MTKTWNEGAGSSLPQMPFSPFRPNQAFAACQPLVEGMAEFDGKVLTGWLALHREWTGFLMRRLQQDVALVHHLAKCAEPQDAFAVYSAFFQKACSDYQGEFAQMAKLGGNGFDEATHALQESMTGVARGSRAAA